MGQELVEELKRYDLSDEEWREYDFEGRVYRIATPQTLYFYSGASTHRILDSKGVVHCVPSVGISGCVLRWKVKVGKNPVAF